MSNQVSNKAARKIATHQESIRHCGNPPSNLQSIYHQRISELTRPETGVYLYATVDWERCALERCLSAADSARSATVPQLIAGLQAYEQPTLMRRTALLNVFWAPSFGESNYTCRSLCDILSAMAIYFLYIPDPTQPNPRVNPTHGQLCFRQVSVFSCGNEQALQVLLVLQCLGVCDQAMLLISR